MLTGYLPTLPQDALLSAGVLFCARGPTYAPIGVTDGAPDFDPGIELGEIMFDNRAASRLKGLTRRVGFTSLIKGTVKEFGPSASGSQLALLEPGETEATVSGVTTITPKAAGTLFQPGDYIVDFRWLFERAGGGYAAIYAPLAIVRKWTKKGQDKKEAAIAFEIEAIGDPVNDLSTAPYAIETRTGIPTGTPTTPAGLLAAYNALGAAGAGATMLQMYQRGVNETAGGAGITAIDDAVNPGHGMHFRPSPETPTGAAIGGNGGTSLISQGLELPATVMNTIIAQTSADTSSSAAVTPATPGGSGLYELFANHAKGLFVGGCGKFRNNVTVFALGETGLGTNEYGLFGDSFAVWAPLADPASGTNGAIGAGGPRMRYGFWLVDAPNTRDGFLTFTVERYGRDLFKHKKYTTGSASQTLTGRRFRWLLNAGFTADVNTEQNLLYFASGRENAAQNKLINDYIAAQWPDTWVDPRQRLGILVGNSWQDNSDLLPGGWNPLDVGLAHDIQMGHSGRGLPALTNTAFFITAWSGDTMKDNQYPMAQLVKDMDFSQRTRVALLTSEFLNGSTLAQNYFVADFLRAISAKLHTTLYDLFYSSSTNIANDTADRTDYAANFAAHADAVAWLLKGPTSGLNQPWKARNFGDGTTAAYPTGQNPLLWASAHPTVLFNQLLAAWYQAGLLRALGDDLSTRCVKIVPSVDGLDLSSGTPTGSASYTCYNFADAVVTGKTFTYDTVILNAGVNAGWSSGAAIATVDGAGVVTRVSAGHCLLRIVSNEGAVTYVDVNCVATTGFSDNFNRTDNALTLGAPWTTWNAAVAGISTNQAYFPSNTANAIATVDAGTAVHTATITLTTASGQDVGLVVSLSDGSNYVRIFWEAGTWYLQKVIAGVTTILASVAGSQNIGDVLTLSRNGTAIAATLNGSALLSATDAFNSTATKTGFTAASSTPRFDNFSWA